MDFVSCLTRHMQRHGAVTPRDIIKFCYQAAFGAEHLLKDLTAAKAYFDAEFGAVVPADESLYEELSPAVIRVNFRSWKQKGLPKEWLFRMFVFSAALPQAGAEVFEQYLTAATELIGQGAASFSSDVWEETLAAYRVQGGGAVHHSDVYRAAEQPAYRIVSSRFLPLLPVLEKLAALPETERSRIIAIDGRAASGKSTAAEALAAVLEAGIVHMDDFFLPPELRTAERLAEEGGNIHYERFLEEVLPHLHDPAPFSYRRFDCGVMALNGMREVAGGAYRIVEGSYSHHPALGDYADVRVFSHVGAEVQKERILHRNGEEMLQMFLSRWIPMEERYFAALAIRDKAHTIIRNDK